MKTKTSWGKNLTYFGVALFVLMIPGSTLILPALFAKKALDKKKSDEFLGI